MAYGFQYIPDAQADERPQWWPAPMRTAMPIAERARIYRVGPGASAVVAAVESLYRDIDELRRTAIAAQDASDLLTTEAAGA